MNVTEYFRKMMTEGKVTNLFSAEGKREKIQLAGMANNLNQLVKEAHTYGTNRRAIYSSLQDTQYIAVSHEDTDDYYLHLVFNRCMNNRKLYNDSWEKIRAIEKVVSLNLKHDLPLKGKQHDVAKTSGVWEFRM